LYCLQYLYENGCSLDKSICENAARNRRFEILKFAHIKECPWDEETSFLAAKIGDLNSFSYAIENGCPWNQKKCLKFAIRNKHTIIVDYINKFLSKDLDKDEVDDGSKISLLCCVCLINKRCIVYLPCGHVSTCLSCAVKNSNCSNCPNCRVKIVSFHKIYFP
jgi:hypothetical protein